MGFPPTDSGRAAKKRHSALIADLASIPGLQAAIAAVGDLPPARYSDEDWQIVRACFALLRHAAGELKVAFAEAGAADYVEVAQIALAVLKVDEAGPCDAAMAIADGIRHLLVDEFQDTSRSQHELLRNLIAAWPQREEQTCFVVGDPMQSIYFFRDADAELFPRVKASGLEIPGGEPMRFDAVDLEANFRTTPKLVEDLNRFFEQVFAESDGSGVTFASAKPARIAQGEDRLHLVEADVPRIALHLDFMPRAATGSGRDGEERKAIIEERESSLARQTEEMVNLIRNHLARIEDARAQGKKYRIAVLGRTRAALAPVATALRAADLPFRAVDLESLKDRPEVLDALALTRALVNPQDRIAWLGVLRAPWCGLSLADLHTLVSADDQELLRRPVCELLDERASLLTQQGRAAVERVRQVMMEAAVLRAEQPASALGTRVEQVWLRLGGSACVSAAERANLDLLWTCLDGLRAGEQDVLGPALNAALDKLMALPDPAADSDWGVQLMTIHKSKGLEFEVVMVPELQAGTRTTRTELLSWMERGLASPEESGEITEFLVAPIQPKGEERGIAKLWVDRARREREAQEMRRLLYVAATRAREELHLFARPEYNLEADGSRTLAKPKESLLKTAWPAVEEEIRHRFDEWNVSGVEPGEVKTLAAATEVRNKPAILHRLPLDFVMEQSSIQRAAGRPAGLGASPDPLFRRHEGGLLSRALGIGVHGLLEQIAALRVASDWEIARAALRESLPLTTAQIRAVGLDLSQARNLASEALEIVLRASEDPTAQWILAPHTDAASEMRWTGVVENHVHSVQVDRVFRGGLLPGSTGDEAWWIVDYKTAHLEGSSHEHDLPRLRELFAPQLETYARILRGMHGVDTPIRAGLYYPRMQAFDWWEI